MSSPVSVRSLRPRLRWMAGIAAAVVVAGGAVGASAVPPDAASVDGPRLAAGPASEAPAVTTRASVTVADRADFPNLPWADTRGASVAQGASGRVRFSITTAQFSPLSNEDWVDGLTYILWYVDTTGDNREDFQVELYVQDDGTPRVLVLKGDGITVACNGRWVSDPSARRYQAVVSDECLGFPTRVRFQSEFDYQDIAAGASRVDYAPNSSWSPWLALSGPASTPPAPDRPTAVPLSGGARVSWTLQGDGGSALTGAEVRARRVPRPIPAPKSMRPDEIVNGHDISISTAPWQVRLYMGPYLCGGSLIDRQWVLTAAHCTDDIRPDQITVWAGITRQSDMRISNGMSVDRMIVHPGWGSSSTNENDLALLHLTEPSTEGTPIPLFGNGRAPLAGTGALVSGWGTTTEGGSSPNNLRAASIQVMADPGASCGSYGSDFVPRAMVCAGTPAAPYRDTCQGDSGGPLAVVVDGAWELAGITSFGEGCARRNYPGVYTRVSTYVPWIYSQMGWRTVKSYPCSGDACSRAKVLGLVGGGYYVFSSAVSNSQGLGSWSRPSTPVRVSR